ncbi:MAG: hypothetical protein QG644_158 [Patescibacteria group bacterium]|nr:hypothetical protein [Patescibacteria group bacterium]
MKLRVIFSLTLFLSSLFAPFWVSALLALFGIVYFKLYWEGVLILLISDFFFGASEARYSYITYVSFSASLLVLIVAEFVKNRMNLKEYL